MSLPILITRVDAEEKIRVLSCHSDWVAEERDHGFEVRRTLMAKKNRERGRTPGSH
jgi:hypothetical protein